MEERLNNILALFRRESNELIPVLQRIQAELGYLPEQAMQAVAGYTGVPESRVYAVATFYAQFRFTPIGKYNIVVCRGTACYVRGATRIREEIEKHLGIKEGGITPDMKYSLETVACIGACGLSPCIMVNKKVKAKMTPKKIADFFARGGDS